MEAIAFVNQEQGDTMRALAVFRVIEGVMTILLDCNPKEGSSCDKASISGERVKKFCKS